MKIILHHAVRKILLHTALPRNRYVIRVLGAALLLAAFLGTLDNTDLIHSHEARAAQNAQRILDTGEWGLPRLFDDRVELQKPPAYYWFVACVSYGLNSGQVTAWTTRLPAALMGIVCVAGVYAFLRGTGDRDAALLAAIVLATASHFTAVSRIARVDIPLTTVVAFSIFSFYRGCKSHSHGKWHHTMIWHSIAGVNAGIAALLKGPVGIALIACPAGLWWLVEHRRINWLTWACLLVSAILVGLPWFIWANWATHGELFRVFILHHTIARFSGTSPQLAIHPWWFYLPRFTLDFLPWSPLFFFGIYWTARNNLWKVDQVMRFSLICFSSMVCLLSISHFKRADYLLPAYPFTAIFTGCFIQHLLKKESMDIQRMVMRLFHGIWITTIVCWIVMIAIVEPRWYACTEPASFAAKVRQQAASPQPIVLFRMEDHLLSFHLKRPLETLVEWNDLKQRLTCTGTHYVIMPKEYLYTAMQIISEYKWNIISISNKINKNTYILLLVEN
jgi:4-amino-4-deoxy-L-arabinose transferase-like glycosyltransferase